MKVPVADKKEGRERNSGWKTGLKRETGRGRGKEEARKKKGLALKLIRDELRPRQLFGQLCLFMKELRSSSLRVVLKAGFRPYNSSR